MANILTYQKVTDTLADIARRHYQINTFFIGEINDLNAEDLIYPVLQMYPKTTIFPQTEGEYKTVNLGLTLRVLDKVTQNGNNEVDIHSDTFQICQDVINELNQHPFYGFSNATLLGDIELNPLNEYMDDYNAGWEFDLNLQLINNNSFCGLPMADITGYSASGPVSTGYSISFEYLQCNDQLSGCSYLTSYVLSVLSAATVVTANYYTTGATLVGTTAVFNRNDMASAYTLDLSSLVVSGYLPLTGGTVTGPTSFTTLSATTYYSGSTLLQNVIQNMITGVTSGITTTHVQPGTNTFTGGTASNPTVNVTGGTFNSINVTGGTLQSGGTDLSLIFLTTADGNDITRVSNGLNTYTGGTANNPRVNISAATLSTLSVSGNAAFSSTITSGGTDLSLLFLTVNDGNDITRVGNGLNTYTGGTANNPTVNVSAATLSTLTVSGQSSLQTILSGGTNLQDIINASVTGVTSGITGSVNINGLNTYTGGTIANQTINISAATLASLSVSGNAAFSSTITSGGTDLSLLFLTVNDGNDITRVKNGLNTYTGGTANEPTVNISGLTVDNLTVSGVTSLNSVSATTYYSGSTSLQDVIQSAVTGVTSNIVHTHVQNGSNTITGGTAELPTVNVVASPSFNSITASGASSFTTLSATTIISGSTDLSFVFTPTAQTASIISQLDTKANLSGATFTGGIYAPTVSGGTLYSGNTDLSLLLPSTTRVGNGLNTYTGGTVSTPTVNVSALTIASLTVSGNSTLNTLSATTISGQTIYLSGSNIYDMFAKTGTTGQFMEVYTASTTWNVPDDVTSVVVEMFGGGGGGGCGAPGATRYGGGGGASGAYILGTVTVMPGSAMTFTIGSGGTPGIGVDSGNPNGINGTNGGDTIFGTLRASGGTFGTNANYNTGAGGVGGTAKSINGNDVYYASNYFFARGFDGQNQTGIPSTSSYAGGGGGDVPMFGRIKMLPRLNGTVQAGTGGLQELIDTDKVGNPGVFVGGGGAGGTGTFSTSGATGGTGSPGMIIIRYNKGTGSNFFYSNAFSGGTVIAATNFLSTISSGGTDLSTLFASPSNITDLSNRLATKANLSGATFTGDIYTGVLSATTLSATTYYSGSTPLSSIIQNMITGVTSGITGSITSGQTVGTGVPIFSGVSGTNLAFRSISAGTNITITSGDTITINSSGGGSANSTLPFNLGVAATDETTALSTGNAKITFLTPRTGTLTKIVAGLSTTGSTTTTVRLNKNGTVVSTSNIDLASGIFTNAITTPTITASTFTAWDTYTVDITAAGTGAKGLKVYFEGNYVNPFTATTSTIPWELGLALYDETTQIATGTTTITMLAPFSGTVTGVTISLSTSGSTLSTVNLKNNGTTIFSTKPTIDANEFSSQTAATPPVITGSTLNVYDTLVFSIDTAGTGAKGLKCWLTGYRNI